MRTIAASCLFLVGVIQIVSAFFSKNTDLGMHGIGIGMMNLGCAIIVQRGV